MLRGFQPAHLIQRAVRLNLRDKGVYLLQKLRLILVHAKRIVFIREVDIDHFHSVAASRACPAVFVLLAAAGQQGT